MQWFWTHQSYVHSKGPIWPMIIKEYIHFWPLLKCFKQLAMAVGTIVRVMLMNFNVALSPSLVLCWVCSPHLRNQCGQSVSQPVNHSVSYKIECVFVVYLFCTFAILLALHLWNIHICWEFFLPFRSKYWRRKLLQTGFEFKVE